MDDNNYLVEGTFFSIASLSCTYCSLTSGEETVEAVAVQSIINFVILGLSDNI